MSKPIERPRCLVVTPTYNERENLPGFTASLFAAAPHVDLLIVDDASPDQTGVLANEMAERDSRVSVLHRAGKLGLGTAYLDGFRRGLALGYDCLIEMDADLSHDPRHLPAMVGAFASGADVVVGSRNVAGGRVEGWGLGRHIMSKGGSLYSRILLGVPVRDLTTGYKLWSRRALEAVDLDSVSSNGYSFQIEMTFRALRRGLRVVEVPIVFVDRRVGSSKMSRNIFLEAVFKVARLRLDAWRGRL